MTNASDNLARPVAEPQFVPELATQAGERSGFAQQIIAQQIIEPPSPGFVGVAANVDAPGELHLTGFGILHVDIDVQDSVANLLHGTPRGPTQCRISVSQMLARIRQHIVAVDTRGGNRMRESCTYGSVRGGAR